MTDDALDATLPASDDAAARPAGARPALGDVVDRYRLIARLGEGGMGVVYRAIDQDLDREVAVKLLRAGHGDGGAARLLEEARAMARLKDPRVVMVHDVGTAGGHDFIAMELIDGGTVAGWLRQQRTWRDVVRVFIAAGRGLAAAHAAGVIHRDFKPSNVLLGADGRVAVGDFGLAVDARARPEELAGTPAYMAPEQLAGEAVDERSDQFSLCVALYEALHGVRPFAGESVAELAAATRRAPAIPAAPKLPARLRRAVLRGLAVEPSARHAHVPALVDELEAVLATPRRRAVTAGIAAGGVLLAAIVTWAALREPPASADDPCATDPLGATWPGARAAVSRGLEVEPTTRDGAIAAIDRYADAWHKRLKAACKVRKRDTPAFHEITACLLDGREEVAALTAELARPSAALLREALAAAETLPDPRRCEAGRAPALPTDPAAREQARAIALELARIRGLTRARPGPAAEAAARAVEQARALGHPPTLAAALFALGDAQRSIPDVPAARASLGEAALAAEEAEDPDTRAAALIALARLEIQYSQDGDAARRAARQASAAAEHAHDPRLRPMLLQGLAELSLRDGDRDAAIAQLTDAAKLDDEAGALLDATDLRRQQAVLMRDGGDRAGALALLDAQRTVVEAELGQTDPTAVALLLDGATVLSRLGRYDDAHAAVADAATRRPPDQVPDGRWQITGHVVDAAGAPVPAADVVIAGFEWHGDGGYLMQPMDPVANVEQGLRVLHTDENGAFEVGLEDGKFVVAAEVDAIGRSTPQWITVTGDDQLTLTLAPWATLEGKVTGTFAPDAHLHIIPADRGITLEVPIVDGAYHARVPAGRHLVQLIRSDDLLRDVKDARVVTLVGGATSTQDFVAPPTVVLTVHVRGDLDIVVETGGVFALGGEHRPLPTRGDQMLAIFQQGTSSGTSIGMSTTPEPGGCYAKVEIPVGTYTVCATGVQGDLRDPAIRERATAHASLYTARCQIVELLGASELTIQVPPPPALP